MKSSIARDAKAVTSSPTIDGAPRPVVRWKAAAARKKAVPRMGELKARLAAASHTSLLKAEANAVRLIGRKRI